MLAWIGDVRRDPADIVGLASVGILRRTIFIGLLSDISVLRPTLGASPRPRPVAIHWSLDPQAQAKGQASSIEHEDGDDDSYGQCGAASGALK